MKKEFNEEEFARVLDYWDDYATVEEIANLPDIKTSSYTIATWIDEARKAGFDIKRKPRVAKVTRISKISRIMLEKGFTPQEREPKKRASRGPYKSKPAKSNFNFPINLK